MESETDQNLPPSNRAYFGCMPSDIMLIGDKFLGSFVNKVVVVYGTIRTVHDWPFIISKEVDEYNGNFSIEILPDDSCKLKPIYS